MHFREVQHGHSHIANKQKASNSWLSESRPLPLSSCYTGPATPFHIHSSVHLSIYHQVLGVDLKSRAAGEPTRPKKEPPYHTLLTKHTTGSCTEQGHRNPKGIPDWATFFGATQIQHRQRAMCTPLSIFCGGEIVEKCSKESNRKCCFLISLLIYQILHFFSESLSF